MTENPTLVDGIHVNTKENRTPIGEIASWDDLLRVKVSSRSVSLALQ